MLVSPAGSTEIHEVESMATLDPFSAKRRKEMTIEQHAGGE